jgi:hypothetical protein
VIEMQMRFSAVSSAALFQLFRDGQARTKAELVEITGLSRSTIQFRIESLLALGLIAPVSDAVSTGGRPSAQIALSPAARIIAAVDFGATLLTRNVTREQVLERLSARDYAYLDARLVTLSSHEHESVLGYFLRTWKSATPRDAMAPTTTTAHAPGDGQV